jgi:transcriptional regulator with XRE-family HTH domain
MNMIARNPNLLRSLFVLRGWSQKDVAIALGMAENTLGRIMRQRPVSRRTALDVARIVEQPVEELFDAHAPKEKAVAE